jgi:hypothetical protein
MDSLLERIVKHARQLSEYQEGRSGLIDGMRSMLRLEPHPSVERAVARVLHEELSLHAREDHVRAPTEVDPYEAHNRVQRQMLLRDLGIWLNAHPRET